MKKKEKGTFALNISKYTESHTKVKGNCDWSHSGFVSTGCSYLGDLIDVDNVVQSQTLRQLHVAAPLQTSELEESGHGQQLQNNKET